MLQLKQTDHVVDAADGVSLSVHHRLLCRDDHGASDATANEPDKNPVSLEDFLSTVYHQLGIDSNKELLAFGTRPIEIVKGGQVVKGLLA